MITPGTTVGGRYLIQGLIGEGGMSTVYEAQHVQIGKRVAVKFLSKVHGELPEALKRFQREAKIAGSIGHINICEVFDFGVTDDGVPFIVMECLDGESVAQMLSRDGRLPVPTALGIMVQVLDALEEVHGRGIVHRDLKPGNIIVASVKGHGRIVKILDFGISKMAQTAFSTSLTKTGTSMGTPTYMSPEQIRESRDIDHRSDLYSCGVILYKMLTGNPPYRAASMAQVIVQIMQSPVPDILAEAPRLPPQLAQIVRKSLDKDPALRFQNAAELRGALASVLNAMGVRSSPGGPVSLLDRVGVLPEGKRPGRRLIVGLVAGILVLAVAVAGGIALHPYAAGWWGARAPAAGSVVEDASAATEAAEAAIDHPPVPLENDTVTLEIRNLPPGSHMISGGKAFESNVAVFSRGSEAVELTIVAPGYEEKTVQVIPSESRVVEVALSPLPIVGAPEETGKKKKKGSKKPGKKDDGKGGDDIDHNWNYP